MSTLLSKLQELTTKFNISPEQITTIAHAFHLTMLDALGGKPSPLKMLPSYVGKPSQHEMGTFLALDFGGTNVRVLLAELLGQGKFTVHNQVSKRLKDTDAHYNYISNQSTAEELFDFIASQIGTVIKPNTHYSLGHTFSFATHQTGLNTGTFIHWSKEIETTGMKDKDINQLLTEALLRKNITTVMPTAIINDTVGALLAASYMDQTTDIGSICGTGHNTAYLEPNSPITNSPMIINIESGNFNQLPITPYDVELDKMSEKPGEQWLEKMVSGHYIGEIVRIIACHSFADGLLSSSPDKKILERPYLFNGAHLSLFHEDCTEDLSLIARCLEETLHITGSSLEDRTFLKAIGALICTRSARLVAATYVGIINHIDPDLKNRHNIAIDGSLYEKMPGYGEEIQATLTKALGDKGSMVTTSLIKDGSGIGATIATAIASGT